VAGREHGDVRLGGLLHLQVRAPRRRGVGGRWGWRGWEDNDGAVVEELLG